jgi:predicted TIM-barrel fold metal-dependent hydrolase
MPYPTRREFLAGAALAVATPRARAVSPPRVIDFHQHTDYSGRTDKELVAHQRRMRVDLTVLLPAGSRYGLAAGAGRNDSVINVAKRHPNQYLYFANELPDIPETKTVLEKYLKAGARGIGEQKFPVECDSQAMHLVYSIAREFDVPVLMHFQHEAYNFGIERLHKMLEKFPTVTFIGHAQTWWGNIDRNHQQEVMYPDTPVTPGGITDRLLSDYPNIYGDLSAGSGRNSMLRDEDHARGFLDRHQDRLLWASDCSDNIGTGPDCIGTNSLAAVRRLAPNDAAMRKIVYENAARLLKLG